MQIGIDARMYGPNVGGGGLGRYVEQLVSQLKTIDQTNRFVLFLKQENWTAVDPLPEHMEKRLADVHWYTLKEQLQLGRIIDRENLDLIHFPHWNVPLWLNTPFIVTIHDLILLEEPRSAHATTRHPLVYAVKYAGYRRVLSHAVHASQHIIAVSEYTKNSILKHFPDISPEKITVIYEGVTDLSSRQPARTNGHRSGGQAAGSRESTPYPLLPTPYFLYVGNAYPHKNLEALLHAFSFFCRINPDVQLVLAGRNDAFYERLKQEREEIGIPENRVIFRANPSDAELADLYRNASLYLFPSRIEGFGLPALEAMQAGIPVAAARSGSLPEILGDAAIYFHPDDIEEMVEVMRHVSEDKPLRTKLIQAGTTRVQQFSWETMARQIHTLYEEIHHR